MTEQTVADFLVRLREGDPEHPPLSSTSAARTVVAVRGFHKFALADGLAAADPARGVKPPAPAKRLPKALPLGDVEAILEASGEAGTTLALRDRALLEVLYGTGARISEAVGLDVDDLDTVDTVVKLHGKGGKERVVPVGSFALEAVDAYLVRGRPELVALKGDAGAVPQRPRRPPVAAVGLGDPGQGCRARRGHQGRLTPHAAALVRHPPARRRRGRPGGAGAARPRLGDDHADLHAGHRGQPPGGVRQCPPPSQGLTSSTRSRVTPRPTAASRCTRTRRRRSSRSSPGTTSSSPRPRGPASRWSPRPRTAAALADGRVSFYTAPIKALVSEKFFALCEVFGAKDVGMLTGDASVNADAPVICCTAEILANIALREGSTADVGLVVMDEFHFYAEPDRGWAWQVPLIELPQAQFVLMSATLGDVTELAADISRRNGRETVLVTDAERPVPLSYTWSLTPLAETLEELVTTHQAPVYVVHFTQKDAVEHATGLLNAKLGIVASDELKERLAGFRFGAGFGKTLSKLLRRGIGVHHAGLLPRYRRLVEQLAQAGLLTVICGTDTLGVGINVPIRTVLFTGLAKYDGNRSRVLRIREFHQIAGRAGRAGFDVSGTVVVQAPEHTIENERAKAKSAAKNAANPKKNATRPSCASLPRARWCGPSRPSRSCATGCPRRSCPGCGSTTRC